MGLGVATGVEGGDLDWRPLSGKKTVKQISAEASG